LIEEQECTLDKENPRDSIQPKKDLVGLDDPIQPDQWLGTSFNCITDELVAAQSH
jgi:hypothetical protein